MNQLCWCGNPDLKEFSPDYLRCDVCSTLKSKSFPSADIAVITDEASDFYGKKYWFDHQVEELGLASIEQRSRSDLLDRCGFWLDQLLEFRLPPAELLEIGCSHGGFLALAELAGFRVTGIELSQWVVEFARKSFGVNVLTGPIERLPIRANSFDVICMFDVLEHLQNPVRTLLCCVQALTPNGIILVQTPQYPVRISFATLQESQHPFLKMMLPDEHLFLFSNESVTRLFSTAGFSGCEFVPAPFAHYDMMLAAGRGSLPKNSARAVSEALEMSPGGRVMQGFLSMARGYRSLELEEEIRTLRGYLEQESASTRAHISKQEEEIRTLRGYLAQESASAKAYISKQEEEIRTLRGYLEQESASAKAHISRQEEEIRTLRECLDITKQDLERERQRTLLGRLGKKLIGFGKRREK